MWCTVRPNECVDYDIGETGQGSAKNTLFLLIKSSPRTMNIGKAPLILFWTFQNYELPCSINITVFKSRAGQAGLSKIATPDVSPDRGALV